MPRPVSWFAASSLCLLLGAVPLLAASATRGWMVGALGDPVADVALDRRGVLDIAQIMTADAPPTGPVVSYEYVVGDVMYVGYHHAPPGSDGFSVHAMDWVDIERLPDQPGVSRIAGRWRQPRARPVAWWDRSRPWRDALSALWLGMAALGLGLTLRAARAPAR